MAKSKSPTKKLRFTQAAAAPLELAIARLQLVVPSAIRANGTIDFNRLKLFLGETTDHDDQFTFSWAGRRNAIASYNVPGSRTLIPDEKASTDFSRSRNLFLEGENLEMLKILLRAYDDQVKCIYIDPPYNTGQDFIYRDDFSLKKHDYFEATGQVDTSGNVLTSNPETSGRFHSDWLTMMYPRLLLAKQLLRPDGLIFVSIDDHEVHNLRQLMNDVFGEENFIESFVWKKSYGGGAKEKFAVTQHEYILLYARDKDQLDDLVLPPDDAAEKRYYKYRDAKFDLRGPFRIKPLEATKSMESRPNLRYAIPTKEFGNISPRRQWWWKKERTLKALANDDLVFVETADGVSVSYKQYLRDEEGRKRGAKPFSIIDGIYTQQGTQDLRELFDGKLVMPFPKPVALMKFILNVATTSDMNELVLDFFAGSATMAQAVLELNREDGGDRRFIMVQAPVITPDDSIAREAGYKTIAEIGKDRIRRTIKALDEKDRQLIDGAREVPEDLGCRVFVEQPSNMRTWAPPDAADADQYVASLNDFVDRLIPGWTAEALLWELAIGQGYSLNATFSRIKQGRLKRLWKVTEPGHDRFFLACLDEKITMASVRTLGLNADDVFACRDSALSDSVAANLSLQCTLLTV